METSQENQIEVKAEITEEMPSDTERLVKLSLKTLYLTFVALALFMTLFVLLFPYPSMKTYMKMGMKSRALECAERYVGVRKNVYTSVQPAHDSKFADALYAGINLSSSLLDAEINKNANGAKVKRIAAQADKFASVYLSYDSLIARTRIVDEYSLSHSLPSMHASVYSFENTAAVLREKAKFILSGTQYSLGYFYENMQADLLLNNSAFTLTDENVDKYIKLFNQLSAIIDYELNAIGFYEKVVFSPNGNVDGNSISNAKFDFDGSQFSLLYLRDGIRIFDGGTEFAGTSPLLKWASTPNQLVSDPRGMQYWVPEITAYVRDYAPRSSAEWAKKVFWTKSLANLTERVSNAFAVMDCNLEAYNENQNAEISANADIWNDLNIVRSGDNEILYNEWYRFHVLPEYIAYLAASRN